MKKYLLTFIFFVCIMNLYSQVKLEIAELNVSNIKPNLRDEIYDEEETDGPYIYIKCAFFNESDSVILLSPSKAKIEILFNYRATDYYVDVFALPFMDNDSVLITSKGIKKFELGTYLLLGTPLWEEEKSDYTMILIEILPTIRVHYKDPYLSFFSSRIWEVNIL